MSNTPNPDYPNPKRLEGMMRSFDYAVRGRCGLGSAEPRNADPQAAKPQKLDLEAIRTIMALARACAPTREEKIEQRMPQAHRQSFWHTFSPLMAIRYIRDTIKLRKYNREWSKNNPPMTIAEAMSRVDAVTNQRTSNTHEH